MTELRGVDVVDSREGSTGLGYTFFGGCGIEVRVVGAVLVGTAGATSEERFTGAPVVRLGGCAVAPLSRTNAAVAAPAVSVLFPETSASLTRMLSCATSAALLDLPQAVAAIIAANAPMRNVLPSILTLSFIRVIS